MRHDAARVVVVPHGEIDIATVDGVRAALRDTGDADVVLDLRDVGFLDTSGLAAIIGHQREATAAGRAFALIAGPPTVQRIFEIAGLTGWLTFLEGNAVDGASS